MDGLEKLENVQRTIHFLRSSGICEADPDAERFLADFAFFLVQGGSQLNLTSKCQLISQNMSKISSSLGALQSFLDGGIQIEEQEKVCADDKANERPSSSLFGDEAVVCLDSMMRSNSSLEDFCRSYFMFHNMDANHPETVFKYLPLLSFTESFIYQLDSLNEKLLHMPRNASVSDSCFEDDVESSLDAKFSIMLGKQPFKPLLVILERFGLLSNRIEEELRFGEEYWSLERKLCHALANNKEISIHDVMKAIRLKSFDYRVLNLLLYQLKGEPVNDLHMNFLSVSELLVEVSDDLFDYEEDILENSFNILRMFVKYYGSSSASVMMAKFITEEEEKYAQLSQLLPSDLFTMYQKRCEEATKEGAKRTGGSPLGTWVIPPVIKVENAFRSEFFDCDSKLR